MITSQPFLTFSIINTGISMKNRIKYLPLVIAFALTGCGGSDSNNAPEFTSNSAFTLDEDTSITGQVVATGDNAVSYTLGSAASNGIFALNADGSFSYTPKEDFAGQDTVTVTATDGSLSTDAELTFTVNNVNDAPTLTSQSITVTTSTTTEGSLTFNDADGDTITVSLVTPPTNGTLTLDEQTGAFTFTAETLSEINDSFVIEFTDGNISSPISATIELKPSYVTNEDKLNYYYSSDKSHLKQAEAISENINDDVYLNTINASLGLGYVVAGFEEKSNQHFNAITSLDEKARAYRSTSSQYDSFGEYDIAAEFRAKSVIAYNQYLAEKGLNNISSDDPDFYQNVIKLYNRAGQTNLAKELLNTLTTFANEIKSDEYTVAYAKYLASFYKTSNSLREDYYSDRTEEKRQEAIESVIAMGELAEQTGYFIEKSGDFKGLPSDRIKALYVLRAAEALLRLNETELAKKYVNLALSLYGITGLDSNYVYQASPYYEATKHQYQFPLEGLTGLIHGLYNIPLDENPALKLMTKEANISDALEYSMGQDIAKNLIAGQGIDDAVSYAKTYFTEDSKVNITSFYKALTWESNQDGAVLVLEARGENELALQVLDYAADILFSEAFITEQKYARYITGTYGCAGIVQKAISLGGLDHAKSYASRCKTMLATYFSPNSELFTTKVALEAYRNLINIYDFINDNSELTAALEIINQHIALLSDDSEKVKEYLAITGYLVRAGEVEVAKQQLLQTYFIISNLKTSLEFEDYIDLVEKAAIASISDAPITTGVYYQDSFVTSLKKYQTSNSQYLSIYNEVIAALHDLANDANQALMKQSEKLVIDNTAMLVTLFARLEDDAAVTELINQSVLGEADKLALYANFAAIRATKNDFPASSIASIDTDHDGKPNFFLSGASEQAIAESGLIADDDADNDGIEDSIDVTPLGE